MKAYNLDKSSGEATFFKVFLFIQFFLFFYYQVKNIYIDFQLLLKLVYLTVAITYNLFQSIL